MENLKNLRYNIGMIQIRWNFKFGANVDTNLECALSLFVNRYIFEHFIPVIMDD